MEPSPSPGLSGQSGAKPMPHPPRTPHASGQMAPPGSNGPMGSGHLTPAQALQQQQHFQAYQQHQHQQQMQHHHQQQQQLQQQQARQVQGHPLPPPGQMHMVPLTPGQAGVFGGVMGTQGTPGGGQVYASVYSGVNPMYRFQVREQELTVQIPVFEAMIRGISVMRRSSDSWVNATQILKVAGIPNTTRTKILDKEVMIGLHEKIQGGYGKYQGTWIPLQRGQELAQQYGVTQYLAPIFDFVPSPTNVAALPVARTATPDGAQKTPGAAAGYSAMLTNNIPRGSLGGVPNSAGGNGGPGRVYSPLHQSELPPPPPPQFGAPSADMIMSGQHHPMYQPMYFAAPPPGMLPPGARRADGLAPPVDINGYSIPPGMADMYIDQFGQPHSLHFTNGKGGPSEPSGSMEPPSKRAKAGDGMLVDGDDDELAMATEAAATGDTTHQEEDDSDDEMGEKPPLPSSMRLSTKPSRPKPTPGVGKAREKLLELFQSTDKVDVRSFLEVPAANGNGATEDGEPAPLGFDIDTVIDDQGHTALHWAASLAINDLVRQLVELGADIHRGNYAGETALMRSVLTTNHAEANSFSDVLEHLAPSIRTLDRAHRTVIHHSALVAGVKGRAGSARQYLIGVLGWVAKEQQTASQASASGSNASENGISGNASGFKSGLSMKTLVDVQDVHGDTALNVAARVGNRGLVGLLVEAGADKARMNKLGLKPADFGVETEALKVSPGEAVVSSLKADVTKPERHSRDVQKNIGAIFETVNETFTTEMLAKQTKLNAIEASVRHATRALADKRQQVQRAQAAQSEMEQMQQRSENVNKALTVADDLGWIGRTILSTESVDNVTSIPPAFRPLVNEAIHDVPREAGEDIRLPNRGDEGALLTLRRMAIWEDRMAAVLQDRIEALQGQGADKAVQYRRLVSLCTKVPVDKVDGMLDGLAAAIESDGNSIDLGRINNFMSRMKQEQAV